MSQPANVPLTADDRVLCINDCLERAVIHINTAIQLYWDKNTLCAITLAGAAESLLDSMLRNPETNPSSSVSTALVEITKYLHKNYGVKEINLNLIRNANKHYESSKQALPYLSVSPENVRENMMIDAEGQIIRAIYNFLLLSGGKISPEMRDFSSYYGKTYPEPPTSSAVDENQEG